MKRQLEKILWVCWKEPNFLPDNDTTILSFLRPAKEEELRKKIGDRLISARKISQGVKDKAREIYIDLIAKVGTIRTKEGKTLREALKNKDDVSLWWFHNVSHKDCESDPTFKFIVEILIIISVTRSLDNNRITLFGGYKEVAQVLKNLFEVTEIQCRRKYGFIYTFIRGVCGRLKYFLTFLWRWFIIKRNIKTPKVSFDLIFSGFWDWSVKEDKKTNKLNDRYFKSLPDKLSAKELKTGWFLWFDPYPEPLSRGRKLKSVLKPIERYSNLVVLQSLIKIAELLKALLNFKPYLVFLSFLRTKEFKEAFVEEGINFYPILRAPLIYGFLNSRIPHFELVYIASLKAFKKYQPKLSLSFLELFLYSRAFYAGGKQGCPDTIHYAVQHASYSRESTFVLLDRQREYEGFPNNCPVPKPDYVFAMGELGKEIVMENGFPEERVFLTGSSRYEHIRDTNIARDTGSDKLKNLFMVTSLDRDLEMNMIEAVCTATKDLDGIRLFLRSHPFAKMQEHPEFHIYKNRIQVTNGRLEEDLRKADLIIFSYSTVAEEALIGGIPVWQWLPVSYNASVFRDLQVIPAFYSISDLRESLKKFISNPSLFSPNDETKTFVLKKCFYAADGKANERIADHLVSAIAGKKHK